MGSDGQRNLHPAFTPSRATIQDSSNGGGQSDMIPPNHGAVAKPKPLLAVSFQERKQRR